MAETQGTLFRQSKLIDDFERFDAEHPDVWEMFESAALELAKRRRAYGAQAVLEWIRWHTDTSRDISDPHIANAHAAFYARRFLRLHPTYAPLFRTKPSIADEWVDKRFGQGAA